MQLGEAGMGSPTFRGKRVSKGIVWRCWRTETMKMSGNQCKWYRVSVNII